MHFKNIIAHLSTKSPYRAYKATYCVSWVLNTLTTTKRLCHGGELSGTFYWKIQFRCMIQMSVSFIRKENYSETIYTLPVFRPTELILCRSSLKQLKIVKSTKMVYSTFKKMDRARTKTYTIIYFITLVLNCLNFSIVNLCY